VEKKKEEGVLRFSFVGRVEQTFFAANGRSKALTLCKTKEGCNIKDDGMSPKYGSTDVSP